MSELLQFGKGNAKLDKSVYTFSVPSGWTCPGALECLSKANRETGKIKDGPHTKFRCFSASQECMYPNVRDSRWHNFELLRNAESMSELIAESIPTKADIIRIHVGGDYFNEKYFVAWLEVANVQNKRLFYFYTKSLEYWIKYIRCVGDGYTPGWVPNFVPTASRGGRHDELILQHNLREAVVVYSEEEAAKLNLEIDHDDTHAMKHGPNFALLVHGTQPAGSDASIALQKLKKEGKGGYSRKKKLISLPMVNA